MERKKELFSSKIVYSKDDYDRLNSLKLKYTDATKVTSRLIESLGKEKGKDILQCGLRVYRIMKDVEEMISPIREDVLRPAAKILGYKYSKQLFDGLYESTDPLLVRRLETGHLLDSRENSQPRHISDKKLKAAAIKIGIDKDQLKNLLSNKPELLITNKPNPKTKSRIKIHGNTNYPLTILIVYLREHLKITTGKYSYQAINDFLGEQEIMEDWCDDTTISRRANRYKLDKLHEVYDYFRDIVTPLIGVVRSIEEILESQKEMRRLVIGKTEEEIVEETLESHEELRRQVIGKSQEERRRLAIDKFNEENQKEMQRLATGKSEEEIQKEMQRLAIGKSEEEIVEETLESYEELRRQVIGKSQEERRRLAIDKFPEAVVKAENLEWLERYFIFPEWEDFLPS